MATLKTVAATAGVSLSTASRVLRGTDTVDRVLAERVRAAAAAVGYRPDVVARNLRLGSTNVIALVIPDVENPFFTTVARAVEDVASAAGYSVLLCNTDENPDKERSYLRVAVQSKVAGIIFAPHGRSAVSELDAADVPIVGINLPLTIDGPVNHRGDLLVDFGAGMDAVVAHLAEEGWTRVGLVAGADAGDRVRAFERAARRGGLEPEVLVTDLTTSGARGIVGRRFAGAEPPDALLVGSVPMTLGALAALGDAGIQVGGDVGVVGVDDAPWFPLARPAITVLSQPARELGAAAARLLLDRTSSSGTESERFGPTLVIRESSRRAVPGRRPTPLSATAGRQTGSVSLPTSR